MEEWQKEIEYHEPLFFKAILTAKYQGELNNYLTEKDSQHREHFRLSYFYDIELCEIKKIKEKDYELTEKSFDIVNYDKVVGEYKGEQFTLTPEELFILKGVSPDHIQYEDEGIHGHFVDAPVVFKVLKPKKKIVCKEGAITKRVKLDDGSTQITKIIDSETCETKTFILPDKIDSCIEEFTGNERKREGWIEREYTRKDCSTYWEKFKEVKPKEPEPEPECKPGYTGKTREYQGQFQKEYRNSDCSYDWINQRRPIGCLEILVYLILAFVAVLILGILIYHNQLQVLGFVLLLVAGLIGINYLIQFFSRFASFFNVLFRVLINLALITGILLLLNGLIQFFQKDHSREKRKTLIENSSEDTKQISPPRPVPKTEPYIYEEDNQQNESNTKDDQVDSIQQIEVNLSWRALDGELYQGSYALNVPDIKSSYNYIRSFRRNSISQINQVYSRLYNHDQQKLESLYEMLDSIKVANDLSDKHFLDVIVSMVQSQEYVLVLDKSCSDPEVLSDISLSSMLNNGVPCESIHPFGLKTPLEFLANLTGDCDTRTLVLYTILKHYRYKVSIINSIHYAHSMLGVDIDGVRGSKKVYGRNNYYFWETTSKGFEIGFLPQEVNRVIFWDVVLN